MIRQTSIALSTTMMTDPSPTLSRYIPMMGNTGAPAHARWNLVRAVARNQKIIYKESPAIGTSTAGTGFATRFSHPRPRLIQARMPSASTRPMQCGRPLPPVIKTTARSRSSTRSSSCLRQHQQTLARWPMSDDDDKDRPDLLPNQARVYRNYLLTCRRIGIPPVSPERAKVLLKEWADSIAGRRTGPTLKH